MGNHPNRTAASPTKCSSDAQGWLPSSLAGRATSANLRAQSACCRGTVAAVRSFRESSTSLDVLPRRVRTVWTSDLSYCTCISKIRFASSWITQRRRRFSEASPAAPVSVEATAVWEAQLVVFLGFSRWTPTFRKRSLLFVSWDLASGNDGI